MRYRLEVTPKQAPVSWQKLLQDANEYCGLKLLNLSLSKTFILEGPAELSSEQLNQLEYEIFSDPIVENFRWRAEQTQANQFIDISFRPGVTDNVAKTACEALQLLDFKDWKVSSGLWVELHTSELTTNKVARFAEDFLGNSLLQKFVYYDQTEAKQRFETIYFPHVLLPQTPAVQMVNLELPDEELLELNRKNCWALNLEELHCIRDYFRKHKESIGPTDVEIEVLAQTWSEHCKHKLFAAEIDYQEKDEGLRPALGKQRVHGLFKTYIKGATEKVIEDRQLNWTMSLFSDNAGVVRFDKFLDVCFKVETHNSPSALDPYGGALTGILGVNRDILGCGLGAKPVANTDVFCFGPPDCKETLPKGLKHPKRILEGVHLGVEDGGNRSGIPTVNGSMYFDMNYSGKPLVYVGTVGVMPHRLPDGRDGFSKHIAPKDRIFVVGGAVGKDGIHGATFSSMELGEEAPATAVQIGDPITQKRVLDFTLEARDLGLFNAITDNGAGGLSSSVGEMATLCGGACLDLSKVPLKYPGLAPFEIMVSESQERMSYAVPVEKCEAFLSLARRRGVEATDIGEFNESGRLEVYYAEKLVADLSLEFLHEGHPVLKLPAEFDSQTSVASWFTKEALKAFEWKDLKAKSLELLARPNIRSKESWVRRYDHEVQAATHVKPFVGPEGKGPSDAGALWLGAYGGEREAGLVVSHGMAPRVSQYDTYWMAQFALDEAVRNAVSVGANPEMLAALDNFCWPDPVEGPKNPDAKHKAAQLVRACRGLYDLALIYGVPFISGKDSMKNDFIGELPNGEPVKISIPPTLLVSAIAKLPLLRNSMSSDFKAANESIYLLGAPPEGLLASEWGELIDCSQSRLPVLNAQENGRLYRRVFAASERQLLSSCHDVSEGGSFVAIVESCLGGDLGAELKLTAESLEHLQEQLFAETPGLFVVSVESDKDYFFEEYFKDFRYQKLGKTTQHLQIKIETSSWGSAEWSLEECEKAWRTAW